jgi:hypothetical protein
VSGRIGLPDSSLIGDIFAAQRIVTIKMKSELFTMCRPRQILSCSIGHYEQYVGERKRMGIPGTESLLEAISCQSENMEKIVRKRTKAMCPARVVMFLTWDSLYKLNSHLL